MKLHDYINMINTDDLFSGDLELSIAYDLYNSNISVYNEILTEDNKLVNFQYLNYINNNNNENKNLIILLYENKYYNIAFYNKADIDYDFKGNSESFINLHKEKNECIDSYEKMNNTFSGKQKEIDNMKNFFISNDFSKLDLKEILKYYDDNTEEGDNLSDVYC